MLVCVEAGLGMEAAFDRVGREMGVSHPLISEMLATVVLEMRAGRSREEALRHLRTVGIGGAVGGVGLGIIVLHGSESGAEDNGGIKPRHLDDAEHRVEVAPRGLDHRREASTGAVAALASARSLSAWI